MQDGQNQSRLTRPKHAENKVAACGLYTQAWQYGAPILEQPLPRREVIRRRVDLARIGSGLRSTPLLSGVAQDLTQLCLGLTGVHKRPSHTAPDSRKASSAMSVALSKGGSSRSAAANLL
jgi:hypothetical protein